MLTAFSPPLIDPAAQIAPSELMLLREKKYLKMAANMKSHHLCSPCKSLVSWTKTPSLSDPYFVMPYKPSFEALETSAAQCPLCQYVLRDVLNGKPRYSGNGYEPIQVSYRIIAEVKNNSERHLINVTWVEDLAFPSAGPRDPSYCLAHHQSKCNRLYLLQFAE